MFELLGSVVLNNKEDEQSKQWTKQKHRNVLKEKECKTIDRITSWFSGLDQKEWLEHLWMKSIQSNNHYSWLISIEHSGMNQNVVWHFEDLEYLFFKVVNTELLSNVTEREL